MIIRCWLLTTASVLCLSSGALAQPIGDVSGAAVTSTGGGTKNLADWVNFSSTIGSSALGPIVNIGGSIPGIKIGELILTRGAVAATTSTDFTDFEVLRTANYTGGSTINAAMRVITTVAAGATSQEWNLVASCTTVSSANCIGAFHQATRNVGGTGPIWADITDVKDATLLQSSLSGGAVLGKELDLEADGIDDATNAQVIGNAGVRWPLNIVAVKQGTDTAAPELVFGIVFTEAATAHGTGPYFDSLIGSMKSFQARHWLDTRGGIAPSGVTDPVSAVMMSANQIIEFNGGTTVLSPTPSRSLVYNSGSTKLQYLSGASELFSDTDAGVFTVDGTLAIAGTQAFNHTNSGAAGSLAMGAGAGLQLNYVASSVNGVQITPAITGSDAVMKPYGDATQNLSLQGAGTGKVKVTALVVGTAVTNTYTLAGAATANNPTLVVAGDTNLGFTITLKGTGLLNIGPTAASAATVAANFVADHRIQMQFNGVSYWVPVTTVAF
jgi:hypothetical protein